MKEIIIQFCIGVYMLIYRLVFRKYSHRLLYINTNKKTVNMWDVERLLMSNDPKPYKEHIYNDATVNTYRPNKQLSIMKKTLNRIHRSKADSLEIWYAGFVSVPFAVYDGYSISNTASVVFVEHSKITDEMYVVRPPVRHTTFVFSGERVIADGQEEVNLIIASSYNINVDDVIKKRGPLYYTMIDLDFEKNNRTLCINYLQDIGKQFTAFLDDCRDHGVKSVHVFAACRQSVAFTLGQSIQVHHPEVYVYEYVNGQYTWGLKIKEGIIIGGQ